MGLKWTFVFSGIIVFIISCNKQEHGIKMQSYQIDSIKNIELMYMMKNSPNWIVPLHKDSVDSDSLVFRVTFYESLIAQINNSGFNLIGSAFATPPIPPPSTSWWVDSVRVFEILDHLTIDRTNEFGLLNDYFDAQMLGNNNDTFIQYLNGKIWAIPLHLNFKWLVSPQITQKHQFKFQFFSKDQLLEKNTNSVIIISE